MVMIILQLFQKHGLKINRDLQTERTEPAGCHSDTMPGLVISNWLNAGKRHPGFIMEFEMESQSLHSNFIILKSKGATFIAEEIIQRMYTIWVVFCIKSNLNAIHVWLREEQNHKPFDLTMRLWKEQFGYSTEPIICSLYCTIWGGPYLFTT